MIAEGQGAPGNRLPRFVPLARDQQHVARAEFVDRVLDRLAPVADLDGAGRGGENRGADGGWLLAARIVVGDDDAIRPGGFPTSVGERKC